MFIYEKKLQFPVKISTPNPRLAAVIISQYGGPDGELGASMRYLSQRYAMPYAEGKGLLTDIGTEELGHMEMVAALVHQLTRNLTDEEVQNCPIFAPYFVDRRLSYRRLRLPLDRRLHPVHRRRHRGSDGGPGRGAEGAAHL